MKWSPSRPAVVRGHMARLGIGAVRVTLRWTPGETSPRGSTIVALRRAQETARVRRLVLAVYSKARRAPMIARRRHEYCSYVANLLALAPRVNDVVIWNEPNSSRFWQPQFDPDGSNASAPAYELLLAECWDVLHAVRPGVNVIAASAPRGNDDPTASRPSQSPVAFYSALGAAYRASGRDRPIFDTIGHNPYPNTRDARPPPPAGPTTRRPSSPTPSDSPTASRTSARSSTSCSPTSAASAGGSRACSGRTGSRSRRTVPSPTPSRTSAEAGSTAPPSAGWADVRTADGRCRPLPVEGLRRRA